MKVTCEMIGSKFDEDSPTPTFTTAIVKVRGERLVVFYDITEGTLKVISANTEKQTEHARKSYNTESACIMAALDHVGEVC